MQSEEAFAVGLKKTRGYEIVPMGEDGACLFRAIGLMINLSVYGCYIAAYHVYGDQEMHDIVRQNCMNFIVCLFVCLLVVVVVDDVVVVNVVDVDVLFFPFINRTGQESGAL